jgi:hypothetical protein
MYGRTAKAYRHPNGSLLLLHRPLSRNARGHQRISVWVVVLNDTLVRRRTTFGRRITAPPIRWANSMIRRFKSGDGAACHLIDGTRPTVRQSVESAPVQYDELPYSLVQPSRWDSMDIQGPLDVEVPTCLPTVNLSRTINGPFAHRVLSQEEYQLFAETWREWAGQHPEFVEPANSMHLFTVCIESVLTYRLQLLGFVLSPRRANLYHASYCRTQRAREALGATRRQRIAGITN